MMKELAGLPVRLCTIMVFPSLPLHIFLGCHISAIGVY
jgi:hypothetical protein